MKYLRIGDFSNIVGVSVKTIRFYEEKGLIKPAYIDKYTGYRYYDEKNIEQILMILQYKNMGFTLEEIKNINPNLLVSKVEYLLNVSLDTVSLDKTVSEDDDTTTIDFVKDTSILDPFNYSENKINKEAINRLLSSLTPREEKVIRMRYGFDDNQPKTLEEVGLEFGVTRERIRQIESKAIRRLRHPARIKQLRELKEV